MSDKFDRHPELRFGDKSTLKVSSNTVMRKREPTNYHTANKNVNMVWDHSTQSSVVPVTGSGDVITATKGLGQYRTMNRTGRPYALGVMVGGSPDDKGCPLAPSDGVKIIKG